jgi:hypothetical protein
MLFASIKTDLITPRFLIIFLTTKLSTYKVATSAISSPTKILVYEFLFYFCSVLSLSGKFLRDGFLRSEISTEKVQIKKRDFTSHLERANLLPLTLYHFEIFSFFQNFLRDGSNDYSPCH